VTAAVERSVSVTSEIGALRGVICHTPGPELEAVTPSTREDFLYDDIIDLEQARREHHRFKAILARFSAVYEVRELLESIVDLDGVRTFLVERVMDVARSEPLARRLMELPGPELIGLLIEGRELEEGPLQQALNVPNYELPPLPNLFFTRDAAMVVGAGVIIGSMRYTVRWTEELLMKALFTYHPLLRNGGIVYDGSEERRSGYTVEGGDVHILRRDLAVIGMSARTSAAALDALAGRLAEALQIRDIIIVVLPVDRAMIHLDMIFTMVDHEQCVVHPASFMGPTRAPVLHYRAGSAGVREMPNLFAALREVGLPLSPINCGGGRRTIQEREQWTSGCNLFAVRPGVVLGYSRNGHTFEELRREGGYRLVDSLDFLTGVTQIGEGERAAILFEGGELVRGGGGSRCMTMPVRRDEAW
jgi:arginine deiminase